MRTWKRLGFTVVSVTTALALAGVACAAPGKNNKNNSRARQEAELAPGATSPESAADGEARHEAKTHKGALQLHRLRARAEIPIPSVGLGILTQEDAEAAVILMVLSRGGVPYAECTLELTEIEGDEAVYKVDVRLIPRHGGPLLREQKGSCHLDPGLAVGIPDVLDGDTAAVTANGGAAFLEGTFED
jgi:hypothetical protein